MVDLVWAQLLPMIERGLRHAAGDCTSSDHLKASIKRGDLVLWAVHDGPEILAAVVLGVHKFPAKTTVSVELAAGRDMDVWVGRIETLLADYRDLVGANTVEATCRAGMAKRLEQRGWRRKAVLMEMR